MDFPRSRPITKKPPINFKLSDPTASYQQRRVPQSPIKKLDPLKNVHSSSDLENLPFQCQPEVRRAKNDLLLKKRSPPRTMQLETITSHVIGAPSDELTNKTSNKEPLQAKSSSPTFKLTVQNVDDPGGTFIKKPTPKFGRRASTLGGQHVSDAQRIRNRTRIIEGNRQYPDTHQHILGGGQNKKPASKSPSDVSPSFIVLNEPCTQTKWMKSSWYDS